MARRRPSTSNVVPPAHTTGARTDPAARNSLTPAEAQALRRSTPLTPGQFKALRRLAARGVNPLRRV